MIQLLHFTNESAVLKINEHSQSLSKQQKALLSVMLRYSIISVWSFIAGILFINIPLIILGRDHKPLIELDQISKSLNLYLLFSKGTKLYKKLCCCCILASYGIYGRHWNKQLNNREFSIKSNESTSITSISKSSHKKEFSALEIQPSIVEEAQSDIAYNRTCHVDAEQKICVTSSNHKSTLGLVD